MENLNDVETLRRLHPFNAFNRRERALLFAIHESKILEANFVMTFKNCTHSEMFLYNTLHMMELMLFLLEWVDEL